MEGNKKKIFISYRDKYKSGKIRGCLFIAVGVLLVLFVIRIFYPADKINEQKKPENVVVSQGNQAIGYWSNALEEYAFDIDQQGAKLFASLYQIKNGKLMLVTNRGVGSISGNNLELSFMVKKDRDSTTYHLKGLYHRIGSTYTLHLPSPMLPEANPIKWI